MSAVPLPVPHDIDRAFWEAAREGRLIIQRCTRCTRLQHPPTAVCPLCGGAMAWEEASGRGRVHTFTVFRRPYHPAFAAAVPYNVSIVQLAEGPLMLSNVVGIAPADLRVGMEVRVVFDRMSDEITLPRFVPV